LLEKNNVRSLEKVQIIRKANMVKYIERVLLDD